VTVLFDVFTLTRAVTRLLDDALADVDLNDFDFAMTSMLRAQGPVSPSAVSAWTGMAPTTVSGVLRRLEQRGLVDRRPNPADGRSHLVGLTEAGLAATRRAQRAFDEALAAVHDHLGDRLPSVRARVQDLDDAVRAAAGLDPRPYRVGEAALPPPVELAPAQAEEVRRFAEWVAVRDG
jgi:DNA-binding MarR family transcriptional regulator